EELLSGLGQHGFGVELNAFESVATVTKTHDDAVVSLRADGEFARKRFSLHDQRMVARGNEGILEAAEDGFAIVVDFAGLAVKELRRANDFAAESRSDRLVPQAHAQNWEFAGEALHQRDGDAGFLRRARAGRDNDAFGLAANGCVNGDSVVAMYFHRTAKFAKILREIVGKGIVVIEQEDHRRFLARLRDDWR